jgi:DNA mismatch repair ATPase MutS
MDELDVVRSFAVLARERHFVRPVISNESVLLANVLRPLNSHQMLT